MEKPFGNHKMCLLMGFSGGNTTWRQQWCECWIIQDGTVYKLYKDSLSKKESRLGLCTVLFGVWACLGSAVYCKNMVQQVVVVDAEYQKKVKNLIWGRI